MYGESELGKQLQNISRYYFSIHLKGLVKTMKTSVTTISTLAKIQLEHLPNTNQMCYCQVNLLDLKYRLTD